MFGSAAKSSDGSPAIAVARLKEVNVQCQPGVKGQSGGYAIGRSVGRLRSDGEKYSILYKRSRNERRRSRWLGRSSIEPPMKIRFGSASVDAGQMRSELTARSISLGFALVSV